MSLKACWQFLKNGKPGSRFLAFYEKRKDERGENPQLNRFIYLGLGVALIVAGVVFLAIPGPGLPVLALGLALIAGESRLMAKGLDKLEIWLRAAAEKAHIWWKQCKPVERAMSMMAVAALLVGAVGAAYHWLT